MATTVLNQATEVGTAQYLGTNIPDTAQFIITGVATAKLEGSLDGVNWVTIITTSVSDAFTDLPKFTHYRGNVISFSSGTVTLLVSN